MDFQDVVRRRKMVRSYTTDPVEPAIVDRKPIATCLTVTVNIHVT